MCTHKLCEEKQLAIVKQAISLTLKQGERSSSEDGSCLYRGDNGLKCAVGQLIKDEHYSPVIENNSVSDQIVAEALSKSLGTDCIPDSLDDALGAVQLSHDGANGDDFINKFTEELKRRSLRSVLVAQAIEELLL